MRNAVIKYKTRQANTCNNYKTLILSFYNYILIINYAIRLCLFIKFQRYK